MSLKKDIASVSPGDLNPDLRERIQPKTIEITLVQLLETQQPHNFQNEWIHQ